MCDNCDNTKDNLESMDLGDHEIAGIALTAISVFIEDYCQQGYADPKMYRLLELSIILAKKFGSEDLLTHLETTKMWAGMTIDALIEEHNLTGEEN
jgi:hypothetical protein